MLKTKICTIIKKEFGVELTQGQFVNFLHGVDKKIKNRIKDGVYTKIHHIPDLACAEFFVKYVIPHKQKLYSSLVATAVEETEREDQDNVLASWEDAGVI